MGRLSDGELRDLVQTLRADKGFRDRNDEWKANRELVFMEREVVFPGIELETEYRTPELLEFADKYTARFKGAPFSIDLSAQSEGVKAYQKAQDMENYDYRWLQHWWDSGVFDGPIHDICGVTGEGWVHLTLNRQVLPIIPLKENYDSPEAYVKAAEAVLNEFSKGERTDLFVLEPVREPETIYYTPDRKVRFMRAEVPAPVLAKQYGQPGAGGYLGEKGKIKAFDESTAGLFTVTTLDGAVDIEGSNRHLHSPSIMLYVIEDAEYIYHVIEDTIETGGQKNLQAIGCYKNVFGAPGFVSMQGRKTNHPAPKHAVHPLTHGAIAVAPNHNILSTVVYSGGILGEMQRIQLEELPGAEAALARANNKNLEIELIGQRVVKFPDGYKAVQPNIGVNADTLNAHAQLEVKMAKLGFPEALGDPAQSDASSGYQQAIQRDTVSSVLDPVFANIANMLSELLALKDTGIKTLDFPVTFRNANPTDEVGAVPQSVMAEITINPEDIVEVDRQVRFDSLTQYARQAKIELGQTLLEAGHISKEMFYRSYMGVDDPERLERRIFVEKALMIADEMALKTASVLFGQVAGTVTQEALTTSGMEPFLQLGAGNEAVPPQPNANGAISVSNGAGGQAPLQPAAPAQTELGAVSEGATFG